MSSPVERNIPAFTTRVAEAAELLREKAAQGSSVQVMSHFDADGLCAGGIIGNALQRAGAAIHVRAVTGLDEQTLDEFQSENYEIIIFADMGGGVLDLLSEKVKKTAIVLDHHQSAGTPSSNIIHVNPHEFGIDGARDVSGAGVSYLVARAMSPENLDLSHLAIVGALGDM
ncbi:MAG: DHH family phosphoesterase, partial [archaeon]